MPTSCSELIRFLSRQRAEAFDLAGRVDARGYLQRSFSPELPLLVSRQVYPAYQHMVGENWLHWHDYFEFFVALAGEGEFCVGDECLCFKPGDLIVVDPLKIHGVMRMDPSHTALVVLFPRHFVAPVPSPLDEAFLAAWEQRSTAALPLLSATHPATSTVHAAVLRLARAWFGRTEPRPLELKLRLLEVLLELRSAFSVTPTTRPNTEDQRLLREQRLRSALAYLSEHSGRSLSQSQVASAAGMSTSRFRAFFKETTGWGFARYLQEHRVERAARLLRETTDSVAEVAHQTGFADQSHLLRCFRAKFGISPKAYRSHQAKS
jgi:AraC-like DNA-binding protein/mannose-6-phosphate isomerase-like protein (cupin superfamily)